MIAFFTTHGSINKRKKQLPSGVSSSMRNVVTHIGVYTFCQISLPGFIYLVVDIAL